MGKKARLSERNATILKILCEEFKSMAEHSPVPSLRKIKRRFSIGSEAAGLIQKSLCDRFSIMHEPRRKIRKPAASVQSAPWISSGSGDCVLCMMSETGYFWQPCVEEYNRTHKNHVLIKYLPYIQSYAAEVKNQTSDIFLFPTNPLSVELVRDTNDFMDLSFAAKELNPDLYYPGIFNRDDDGKLWGIGVNCSMSVLCSAKKICRLSPILSGWDEFIQVLRGLRADRKKIRWPFVFKDYYQILRAMGVRYVTENGKFQSDPSHYEGPLKILRMLIREELAPMPSLFHQSQNSDLSMFLKGEAAIRLFNLSRLFADEKKEFCIVPMPTENPSERVVYSEILAVNNSSMNYERAWNFIRFVLSSKIQKDTIRTLRFMPAMRKVCPESYTKTEYISLASALEQAKPDTKQIRFTQSLERLFNSLLDRHLRFGVKLRDFLQEMEIAYDHRWKNL